MSDSLEGCQHDHRKKPASKAGKELGGKKSTSDEKTVAASDLAQATHKAKPKPKKPRK